ncbi:thrombospondin type 3 repeat-containing protein, partial [bacterium]|nr:thrombospondin type 3 repeat-containing protein [bacterium]
ADVTAGKGIIVKGSWNISFWAKGAAAGDRVMVKFGRDAGGPTFVSEVITVSTEWQQYTIDFAVADGVDEDRDYLPTETRSILSYHFMTNYLGNTGSIWIDDVFLGKPGQINSTALNDTPVELLKELNPGILRGWYGQLGISLEEFTDPVFARGTQGYNINDRAPYSISYSLHEFFELAREVGSLPWVVAPPAMSAQEFSDLVDFLSGPVTTIYGAKRASLGQTEPWTDVFATIYIEFGNELWGSGAANDPFGGASVNGGIRLGEIAHDRFGIMRANPNFNGAKTKLIIGGLHFQSDIEANSSNHDLTALSPYFGDIYDNFSSPEEIYGTLYAEPTSKIREFLRQDVDDIIYGGNGTLPAIYEINFHTTAAGGPSAEIRNKFVTGQGGGIALSYNMLTYLKYLGIKEQTAFTSWQYSFRYNWPNEFVRIWGMLRDVDRTQNKRPTWLSVEAANKGIFGNMTEVLYGGDDPTWVQPAMNSIAQATQVPYIHAFSFNSGSSNSVILYNLHRTDTLNVKLDLPRDPSSSAAIYKITNTDIEANNESAVNVVIDEQILTGFADNYPISLTPHSMTVITYENATNDIDADGIPDAFDNCPETANPGQTDSDSDGYGDLCDNCSQAANASQADIDQDGIGNECDSELPPVVAVFEASRISGVSPLAIFFDATGSIASAAERPFHELDYTWDFGDPDSGDWQTSGKSKNRLKGALASHVFEPAFSAGEVEKSFIVTLTITDMQGNSDSRQISVTVQNPDIYFAGNETRCVSISGNFEGCPAGGEQVVSSSFDQQIRWAETGTDRVQRRLLFHNGENWDVPGSNLNSDGPGIIGAYGTGPKPRLTTDSPYSTILTVHGNDWRIMDIEFAGPVSTETGWGSAVTIADNSNILMLRNEVMLPGFGFFTQLNAANDSLFWIDNYVHDTTNVSAYIGGSRMSVMGNTFKAPQNAVFINYANKGIISHNTLHSALDSQAWSGALHLSTSAAPFNTTEMVMISDNEFRGPIMGVRIAPFSSTEPEMVRNVVVERNTVNSGTKTQIGLRLVGRDLTARNNIMNAEGAMPYYQGVSITTFPGMTEPTGNISIYNNLAYRSELLSGYSEFAFVRFWTGPIVNVDIKNNVMKKLHAAESGFDLMLYYDASALLTGLTADHNIRYVFGSYSTPDSVQTDPLDGNLYPAAGGPAIDTGAAVPVFDTFDDQERPNNLLYDMGPYEYYDLAEPLTVTAPADIITEATGITTALSIGSAAFTPLEGTTISNDAPAVFPIGTTTVTWTAADAYGNFAAAFQTITVQDTTAPVLTVPADIITEASGITTALNTGQAGASDASSVTITNNAPALYALGTTIVTWTATDAYGNFSTAVQTVTVQDTTAPIIAIPADITAEASGTVTTLNIGQASGTDVFTVTISNNAPAAYALGITSVTWTALDSNGNTATAVQTVTVQDLTAPALSVPDDINIDVYRLPAQVDFGQASATDIFPVTLTNDAPVLFPYGATIVTWTALDVNGNSSTDIQIVVVDDYSDKMVIYGSEMVKIKRGASISGGIVGSGGAMTVGKDAIINADIYAGGNLHMQNSSTVNGKVQTGGIIEYEANSVINGTTGINVTELPGIRIPSLATTPGTAMVTVPKNGDAVLLPGSYNKVKAQKNAVLRLAGGRYAMKNFI